jgi:hypothetical protein
MFFDLIAEKIVATRKVRLSLSSPFSSFLLRFSPFLVCSLRPVSLFFFWLIRAPFRTNLAAHLAILRQDLHFFFFFFFLD